MALQENRQEKNATSYDERQGYLRDRQSPILNLATAIMGADQQNTPPRQDSAKEKKKKKLEICPSL